MKWIQKFAFINLSGNYFHFLFKKRNNEILSSDLLDREKCAQTKIVVYNRTLTISNIQEDVLTIDCNLVFNKALTIPAQKAYIIVYGLYFSFF